MTGDDDSAFFRNAIKGVKPLPSTDKVVLSRQDRFASAKADRRSSIRAAVKNELRSKAYFAFSDAYEAHFTGSGPLKYVRNKADSDELKRLRRGDYVPDLILDLHGLTRESAKSEIAALLYEARQQHLRCVCIVHGIGSGVLRQQGPNWLVQHPDIIAFHQSTLEWGGNGSLLALLNTSDPKLG